MTKKNLVTRQASLSSYLEPLILSRTSFIARIHSVFANGFNVQYDKQLIYVAYEQDSLSAIGMNIKMPLLKDILKGITVGDQVRIQRVALGKSKQLSLKWTIYSRPEVLTFTMENMEVVDLTIPTLSREAFVECGLVSLIEEVDAWEQSGFGQNPQMKALFDQFVSDFKARRRGDLRPFIGAGLGLTPSGDDFLQGLILLEKVIMGESLLQDSLQGALKTRSTTDVSRAYFQALFEDVVNSNWIDLFEAIKQQDVQKIKHALKMIQEYGATSGNDFLVGLHTYLTLF